jgi:xanthine dehydrogenase molybdopterin-binding subunit B
MLEMRKDIFADERDDSLKEVGQPTPRQDILGHVTGTSAYYDDHRFANLLHLKILRSPHAHARIRSTTRRLRVRLGSNGSFGRLTCLSISTRF